MAAAADSLYTDIKKNSGKFTFIKVGSNPFSSRNSVTERDVPEDSAQADQATQPELAGFSFIEAVQKALKSIEAIVPCIPATFPKSPGERLTRIFRQEP